MLLHWSLRDSKSPQVSRTLLSILANLNNMVIWMVSIWPLISKSSSPFTKHLVTVPSTPITIGFTVTFMFHCFLEVLWQGLRTYLSFPLRLLLLRGPLVMQSPLFCKFSFFFLLIITRSVRPAEIRWSACISKIQRTLCVKVKYHLEIIWLCTNN